MSSTFPCGCSKKWIKITDLETPCVEDNAKFAIEEFNIKHNGSLRYKKVIEGWCKELDESHIRYRLLVQANDCLRRLLEFEAIVFAHYSENGETTRILESFEQRF
ncbi:uncharacterized protein LOC120077304 [Benincasa hispida]|uniref:uncharacterized protein LOC120077304 n=1 Tax=Benincasa hispida TaxID=102211 RepID=UPI0019008965|nr:uncharacterized protein LOC120077304 [Benincasa hispida]